MNKINASKNASDNKKDASKPLDRDPKTGRFLKGNKIGIGNNYAVGHGAPKGNKNALGNKGGKGAPLGNKYAAKKNKLQ